MRTDDYLKKVIKIIRCKKVLENIFRYGRLRNLLFLFEMKHNIRLEKIKDEELSNVLDALYYECRR